MYHAPGIGLAAPQVGVGQRIFVMDIDYDREEIIQADGEAEYKYENLVPRIIINPKFENQEGEILYEEGCLSVPGVYEQVKRAEKLTLHYQDVKGEKQSLDAEGLLSVCLQHENDHLDGIVFIERLSMIKKNLLMKKFLKTKKK
jgi:peptide deformylase